MTSIKIDKESLHNLYLELDQKMRDSFSRSLPFEEYIFDRFERAKVLNAGESSSVHHSCYVYGSVKIGKESWIGPFTLLDGSGGLEIGDNCSISSAVHIYSHDTVNKRMSGGLLPADTSSVKIGHSCYIGPHSVIAKGVTLGEGCIVGANSFVSKSFPAHSVILGTPGRLRGHVCIESGKIPKIQWLDEPSVDLSFYEKKIKELESKLLNLEQKVNAYEKI